MQHHLDKLGSGGLRITEKWGVRGCIPAHTPFLEFQEWNVISRPPAH